MWGFAMKMGHDRLGPKLKLVLSGYCFVRGKGGEAINLLLSCLEEGGVHSRTGSHISTLENIPVQERKQLYSYWSIYLTEQKHT